MLLLWRLELVTNLRNGKRKWQGFTIWRQGFTFWRHGFQKETLGRDLYLHEILEKTHMCKGDGNFVDNKSKQIFDRVVARYESEVSAIASDSSTGGSVDANKIYFDEVGGMKKQRIYGIGSAATSYDSLNASNATCSSHSPPEDTSNNLQSIVEQLQSEKNAERESHKQTETALLQRVEEKELKFQEFLRTFSSPADHSVMGSVDLSADDVADDV